jgi:hypothetical protein
MNRRDFLKGAGAAIVPVALPGGIWGTSSVATARETSREVASITAVVCDGRYADCNAFADALALRGAKAFATNADAVQLWYGPLRAHLTENPGGIAGLTTYADFSVSLSCGRELNFAPLYEGEHDGRRSRADLAHRLCTSSDDREIAAAFADASWATQLADALARVPIETAGRPATARSTTATTPRSAGHPGFLSSWLLVPRKGL